MSNIKMNTKAKAEPKPKAEPKKNVNAPECTICAEKFNKSNRIPIVCMSCEFTACMACSQTYILSESVPHCMNTQCGKEWTRHFMSRQFPKSFMKTKWRDHVCNQLYEREKSLLPRSQITIEMMMRRDFELSEANRLAFEIEALKTQFHAKNNMAVTLSNRIRRRCEGAVDISSDDPADVNSERRKFTRNCPAADCRGFLSQQWKCGICEKWSCPECHEVVGDTRDSPHECKDENIQSAKEVMKSTKPCPKCATPIFRTEGCPQMWCTMCHSGFNWNTGKAYASNTGIHNPHYFEYMRNQGANVSVNTGNPCVGWNSTTNTVIRYFYDIKKREFDHVRYMNAEYTQFKKQITESQSFVIGVVQAINHIEQMDMGKFNTQHLNNEVTRCEYLKNRLDETEFKHRIGVNIRRKQKNDEYNQLFQMFLDTAKDVSRRYFAQYQREDISRCEAISQEYYNELMALIQYCNAQSIDISETFDTSVYYELDIKPVNFRIAGTMMQISMNSTKRVKSSRKTEEPTNEKANNVVVDVL